MNENTNYITCPLCGEKTEVTERITSDDGESLRRRRVCASCGYTFLTEEVDADYLARLELTVRMLSKK